MDRRTFIGGVIGGFVAAPLAVDAQPAGKVGRIGVLGTTPPATAVAFHGFQKGLGELGYVEGQNIHLEYRWPQGERAGWGTIPFNWG